MEFNTEEYKRRGSNVFTSADGFKYVQSKIIENSVYLKCAIFRNGCKGTAKLNLTRQLITPICMLQPTIDNMDLYAMQACNLLRGLQPANNEYGTIMPHLP